jgi:PhnB protein
MRLMAHLHFKGDCREAFADYATLFGGEIVFAFTFGEAPASAQVPAVMRDWIAHARVDFKGQFLVGCDVPPERYQVPQGFNVLAMVDSPAEAERLFTHLAQGGTISMAFQQTFFAYRFGMCTDRFGTPWMINCEKAP